MYTKAIVQVGCFTYHVTPSIQGLTTKRSGIRTRSVQTKILKIRAEIKCNIASFVICQLMIIFNSTVLTVMIFIWLLLNSYHT